MSKSERWPYFERVSGTHPHEQWDEDDDNCCEARAGLRGERAGPDDYLYFCTREKGHEGPHLAGVGEGEYSAIWADEDCYEEFMDGHGLDMPGAVEYHHPPSGKNCGHRPKGHPWTCTREKGHKGLCMGGRDDHTMIAWWSGPKVVGLPPDVEAGLKALGL